MNGKSKNGKSNLDCNLLCDALWSGLDHTKLDVSATRNSMDNTVSVRLYLLLRGVSTDTYNILIEPYDNGFYKRADGKSTPFGIFKIASVQKRLRFKKDVVSVRHDLDYYLGVSRKEADERYRDLQNEVGHHKWKTALEYGALRLFGRIAWRAHAQKRATIEGYGTVAYIKKLPIFRDVDQNPHFHTDLEASI